MIPSKKSVKSTCKVRITKERQVWEKAEFFPVLSFYCGTLDVNPKINFRQWQQYSQHFLFLFEMQPNHDKLRFFFLISFVSGFKVNPKTNGKQGLQCFVLMQLCLDKSCLNVKRQPVVFAIMYYSQQPKQETLKVEKYIYGVLWLL